MGSKCCALNPGDLANRDPRIQSISDSNNRFFAHPIADHVSATVEQHRSFQLIGPVVVVRQATQRSLHPTHNNRGVFMGSSNQITVDHRCMVGTQTHLSTRGIEIAIAMLLCNGVVAHHRIHVSRADQKRQAGLAEHIDAGRVMPIRLRNNTHFVAICLKQSGDDSHTERRMVHVRIATNVHKIALVPSALFHFFTRNRQKGHGVPPLVHSSASILSNAP